MSKRRRRVITDKELVIIEKTIIEYFSALNRQEVVQLRNKIMEYLKDRRDSIETLVYNFKCTYSFLECLSFSEDEIFQIINNFVSIIHFNKEKLLYKCLLLPLLELDGVEDVRRYVFINRAKDLMCSLDLIYARIRYLDEMINEKTILKAPQSGNLITPTKVLKYTSSEFQGIFGVSTSQLLDNYRFYVKDSNGNKIVNRLF